MFKKRLPLLVLLVCLSIIVFPLKAQADFGPKPSVTVNFEGLENVDYYATLLSKTSTTGPHSAEHRPDNIEENEIPIWDKFDGYNDEDGFYFLNYLEKVESHSFFWGYYPPSTFKILIYIPQSDTFICSGVLTTYAFHSVYKAEVDLSEVSLGASNVNSMEPQKSHEIWKNLLSFAARAVITIVIEILVALAFGFIRKKQLLILIYTNLVTQILLNIALIPFAAGYWQFVFLYIFLELAVLTAEALVYVKKLLPLSEKSPQNKVWFIITYSLAANLISFGLGLWLASVFPILG